MYIAKIKLLKPEIYSHLDAEVIGLMSDDGSGFYVFDKISLGQYICCGDFDVLEKTPISKYIEKEKEKEKEKPKTESNSPVSLDFNGQKLKSLSINFMD